MAEREKSPQGESESELTLDRYLGKFDEAGVPYRHEGGLIIVPNLELLTYLTEPPGEADLSNPQVKEYLQEEKEFLKRLFQSAIDNIVLT